MTGRPVARSTTSPTASSPCGRPARACAPVGCRARSRSWSTSNIKAGRRFGLGAVSDADNRDAALHALDTAGRRDGDPARDATNYLVEHQAPNGSFSGYRTRAECAVDGLCGARPRRRTGPSDAIGSGLRYLRRRPRSHGAIRYSSSSQSADAGLGHRAGPPSSEAESVPARSPSLSQCGARPGRSKRLRGRSGSRIRDTVRGEVRLGRRAPRHEGGLGHGRTCRRVPWRRLERRRWRQRRTQPLGSPLS